MSVIHAAYIDMLVFSQMKVENPAGKDVYCMQCKKSIESGKERWWHKWKKCVWCPTCAAGETHKMQEQKRKKGAEFTGLTEDDVKRIIDDYLGESFVNIKESMKAVRARITALEEQVARLTDALDVLTAPIDKT